MYKVHKVQTSLKVLNMRFYELIGPKTVYKILPKWHQLHTLTNMPFLPDAPVWYYGWNVALGGEKVCELLVFLFFGLKRMFLAKDIS